MINLADEAMTIKLDYDLPEYPKMESCYRRAPRRESHLTEADKALAIKNALRYIHPDHHEQMAKEFAAELEEHGRIYGYRFRPEGKLYGKPIDEYKGLDISEKGKVYDLIVPILVLIFFSILGMMYTGGFFEGVDFATAVGENPVGGLCIGATVALCVAGAMFLPRGLTTLSGFVESISEGVRSMVGAIMILVLAWSLGGCCRYMLGTGDFVSSFLNSLGVSLAILPCIIFLAAGFIGFAMGTSWGTIALILPIVVGVFNEGDPLFLVAVGATLAGAVYGDHISPISDTTILSSAGAKCNHLRHVATQLPYATTVMVVCFVCYVVAGFTGNPWISLVLGAVLIVVAVKILHKSNIGVKK